MAQPVAALRRRMRLVADNAQSLKQNIGRILGTDVLKVDRGTFHSLLEALGVYASGDAVTHAFAEMDVNVHGSINVAEFCEAMFPTTLTSLAPAPADPRRARVQKSSAARAKALAQHSTISDPDALLKLLEHKITRNVSGVATAYRHFRALASGNGSDIDQDGFCSAVKRLGISTSPACCAALFKKLDPNTDGTLDLNEFIKGILHSQAGNKNNASNGRRGASRGSRRGGSARADLRNPPPSALPKKQTPLRRELMAKEKMATYIVQLRDKFMQHGGNGHKAMLNTWHKLRVFSNARVPNMVTFSEFDKGLKAMGVPLPPKVVASIFAAIDNNGSGTIDFKEFARYVFPTDGDQGNAEDWQRLGAATKAARRSQRLEKTLGLIRKPAVLQVCTCAWVCVCV